MSRLFLKISVKISLVLWITVTFCSGILAIDNNPDPTFEEHCKNSDAYLLYSYTDVTYSESWVFNSRLTSIQRKLVVNNRSGVEKYAFVNISKDVADHLKTIQINTLKADGTVVKLDSSLIFKHQLNAEQTEQINYPIPGVEPGDTIAISYMYAEDLQEYEMKDFVNLYRPLPSFTTEYSIRTPPDLFVRYKTYNGFPEPGILKNDTLTYCLFKMQHVKGLSENRYTCQPCELPYMYYSVDKEKNDIRTWKEVYNQEFNFITQPLSLDYEKSSYYRKWKKKVIGEAADSNKYYKLHLLLTDIYNNIQMEPFKKGELIKSSGYFLKERRFDPISIRRLYRQILEDLGIGYRAVFARSKQLGKIDPYYIRKGEYNHIFFAFENSQGTLNLLYPHDVSFKYQIGEIPTSLYNTEAVIAKPYLTKKIKRSDKFIGIDLKMAEVDSVIVNLIKLPEMGANYNYIKQVFYCDVDVRNKNTSFKSDFSVSGGLSTDVRSFFSLLNQNKEMNDFYDALAEFESDETALKIDTVIKAKLNDARPFVYNISAQGKLTKSLSFINDSMVSITLDNLIQHNQVESEIDSMELNYYLDYSYTDLLMLVLKFPCNIELLSFDGYRIDIKNNVGEYIFNLNLTDNNQLFIQSDYKISNNVIPKSEYDQLKQLNELVQEIKNIRLLIKLKK